MFDKQYLGYVEKDNFLGLVVGVDLLNGKIVMQDGESEVKVEDKGDVELLEEIGKVNGEIIFHKDVFINRKDESMFLIELHENGEFQFHRLDKKLNRVASGAKFKKDEKHFEMLGKTVELLGSFYTVREALIGDKLDFNIKIVKDFNGEYYTYFYACNNKETEEIDLIKVVFIGHQLLKEENYERRTLSHEVYLDSISAGTLKEATPQELMNYVTGVTYKEKDCTQEEEDNCCESDCCEECCEDCCQNDCCEEEVCEDCEQYLSDCECDLW